MAPSKFSFAKFGSAVLLTIRKFSETMSSNGSSLEVDLPQLKDEFEKRFHENRPSESSEKLKEFMFLAILGQGAFGLVVIYHSSFYSSLHFLHSRPKTTFSDLETCETRSE